MEEASAGAGEASASVSGGGSSSGARRRSSIFRMGSLLQTDSQLWASQVCPDALRRPPKPPPN
eukprot:5320055-Prymnesium_polylepis.1